MAAHARGKPTTPPNPATAGGGGEPGRTQQRLQGAFLTIIGLAGILGGVLFSIEAPRFTPVPVVFLTFWLVMVIVGRILFTGLNKLRAAGIGAPAPEQLRAAAAVAGIVVAVGMMGFAATGAGSGVAAAAPCPGGGPATCGPTPGAPELTFTPPAQQTTAPGQQGQQGSGQDNNGIATSPNNGGGENGPGIQAQTPQFGTPGQQAPNIPGNEQPGQGQQPAQGQQTGQQNPVRTTAPGQPQQTGQQNPTSPSQPTVTVTQTQSQCPAPGAPGSGGAPGAPGAGSSDGGTTASPDGGDSKDGAPSWAYLVGEAAGIGAGRRRPPSGGAPTAPSDGSSPDTGAADTLESARQSSQDGAETAPAEGSATGSDDDGSDSDRSQSTSDSEPSRDESNGDGETSDDSESPQTSTSDDSESPQTSEREEPSPGEAPRKDGEKAPEAVPPAQSKKPGKLASRDKSLTPESKAAKDSDGKIQRDDKGRTIMEENPDKTRGQHSVRDYRTDAPSKLPTKDTKKPTVNVAGDQGAVRAKQFQNDMPGNGKGKTDLLYAGGEWHAGAKDGHASAGVSGDADLARTEGKWKYGGYEAKVGSNAGVNAEAGKDGVGLGAEAFAGAKAGVNAKTPTYAGVGAGAGVEARAGLGAGANVGVTKQDNGAWKIGASANLTLGIGGKVGGEITVNPSEVVDAAKDAGGAVVDGAKSAGSAVSSGVKKAWGWLTD